MLFGGELDLTEVPDRNEKAVARFNKTHVKERFEVEIKLIDEVEEIIHEIKAFLMTNNMKNIILLISKKIYDALFALGFTALKR